MTSVYKNDFAEILIDFDRSMIFDKWTEKSERMESKDFIDFFDFYTSTIQKHKIISGLVDARKLKFVIMPELQEFVKSTMGGSVKSGFRKYAIVMPKDSIYARVSVYQMVDEIKAVSSSISARSFEDIEEAENWLL